MTDQTFNNIYCSKNWHDFYLLYDGQGTYYIYYMNDMLLEIKEPLTPKQIHSEYNNELFVKYSEIKDKSICNFIDKLLETIANRLGDITNNDGKITDIGQGLITSLKNAFRDPYPYNREHFENAPKKIQDKARLISEIKGHSTDVFDDLLTPKNIEEEIQARAKPILTKKEKEKADAIADKVNEIGLLAYLKNILDNIHIGEHKNIYRKMLMLFKIMRGEASFLSETTAKAEAGKSFEDEIVFELIAPPRYIFKADNITLASFVRYALINPEYFNRMIIYFGDKGGKKSFKQIEDVFNLVKPLITEGKFTYIKSKKDNDTEIIEIHLKVESIGAVYQTTQNSFTEDDNQLISRTLFSTPAIVEDALIMKQQFYLNFSKSKQSKAKTKAEQDLRDFGLYLLQMVNTDVEIVNPYIDVFMEYALKSENPKRELNQQLQLFDAYCILTQDKCITEYKGTKWASLEQLKEYMDYINLENALIPYEFDFLQMIMAKGKKHELTILYEDDAAAPGLDDLTLIECENYAIELINNQLRQKKKTRLKSDGYDPKQIDEILEDYEPIQSKEDLSPNDLKTLPYRLNAGYGLRSDGADHIKKVFFRYNDLKNLYSRYGAFKNVDNVPKLLNSLYNKGYLGKYEYKHGKENLYYLTPLCEDILTKFEPAKTFDDYAGEFIANTGYENF